MALPVGKILTTGPFLDTLKENVHRTLDNYYGVEVDHYRRKSDARDVYYDEVCEDFIKLNTGDTKHLIQLSSQDYDTLTNLQVHLEPNTPILVLLDPTVEWLERDEIQMILDIEKTTLTHKYELVKIIGANRSGVTVYQKASLAPVREQRTYPD